MSKREHDFSWQVCHNHDCPMYNVREAGNIKFHAHYGRNKEIHEIKCERCGSFFSENKGTPFFDLRLPREKILLILKLLAEGNGIRGSARIAGVHRDTVARILERTAAHLEKVGDQFLVELKANEIQFDELWTYVKKRNAARKKRAKK